MGDVGFADMFARFSYIAAAIVADLGELSVDNHGFGNDARSYGEGVVRFLRFGGRAANVLVRNEAQLILADRADAAAVCCLRTVWHYETGTEGGPLVVNYEKRPYYAPTAHGAVGSLLFDLHRWALDETDAIVRDDAELDEDEATRLWESVPSVCGPLSRMKVKRGAEIIARMQRERTLLLEHLSDADEAVWSPPEVAGEFAKRLGIDRKTFKRRFDEGMYPGSVADQRGERTLYRLRLDRLEAPTRAKLGF